tara:strand:- start:9514 stop:9891 length:378 start_codon:yes stop_codon:yes gene_type:complete
MSEKELHIAVCKYLKMQYPSILFSSEQSGLRVSMYQAKQLKATRSCSGLPDIMIFEPRKCYYGLFLEIKKEGTKVYKKNGDLRSDSHLEQQEEILHQLKQKGYFAEFIVGFDQAKAVIDYYFSES